MSDRPHLSNTPLSILDLAHLRQGATAEEAFHNARALAQHAESLGYKRFWLAEHHNISGVACSATSVLIAYIANATTTIRVGSGGIMLPNHAPLAIAEQFGTLESLFPGRIDLGLGRAPGSDQATARALRRNLVSDPDQFPQDVLELMGYLGPAAPEQRVMAIPGTGLKVPIWILGSSLFGAQVAAALGLPFSFASHFAPAMMMQAIDIYRARFQPSEQLDRPYVMLGFNVIAADSDAQARLLATSVQQAFVNLRSGRPIQLPPPLEGYENHLAPPARALLADVLTCAAIGSPQTVRNALAAFIERTKPDELMITAQIFDHSARLRSYEIAADIQKTLN